MVVIVLHTCTGNVVLVSLSIRLHLCKLKSTLKSSKQTHPMFCGSADKGWNEYSICLAYGSVGSAIHVGIEISNNRH